MSRTYMIPAILLVLALAGCVNTPAERSALDNEIARAKSLESAQERASSAADIMALADQAQATADQKQAAGERDAEIVWRAIAANGYDAASLIGQMDQDAFSGLRGKVRDETTRLDDLCTAPLPDTRLGYYCALGLMFHLTNESEIALVQFETAVAEGNSEAAASAAELYASDVSLNWSRYEARVAALSASGQDRTPVRQRQLASACALHSAANSGSPPWVDRQLAADETIAAAQAYVGAAAMASKSLALSPQGNSCGTDPDSLRCQSAMERALGAECQARSGGA